MTIKVRTTKESLLPWLISLGTALEYYDLLIYGLLAKYISQVFYSSSNSTKGLFWTFLVFALGQAFRYVGGIVLGFLGDRYGREKTFLFTIWSMAMATLTMGLLPSAAVGGIFSTIIFSLSRLIQSLAFGAEFPGALTILSSKIKKEKLGRSVGNMMASSSIGAALGICFISLETHYLTETQMLVWGFRIPFILGGSLALIGGYLRKHIKLSASLKEEKERFQAQALFPWKKYRKFFICLIGASLFPATVSTLKQVFIVYLNNYYHYPISKIYLLTGLGYLLSVTFKIFGGYLADYTSKTKVVRWASIIGIVGLMITFYSLTFSFGLIIFVVYSNLVTSLSVASYYQLSTESFPLEIRYTWVSLMHNSTSFLASLVPLIMNFVYGKLNNPFWLIGYLLFLGIVMLASSFLLDKKNQAKIGI